MSPGSALSGGRNRRDADQIDIAFAVDLAAGQKKHIDPALPRAIEQFARAVGEESVRPTAEQRDVGFSAAAFARQQRSGRRDRRRRAPTADMAHVADQPGRSCRQVEFFVAESFSRHRISRLVPRRRENCVSRMRCAARSCAASGIAADSLLVTIPGLQRTTPLRSVLRRARETRQNLVHAATFS